MSAKERFILLTLSEIKQISPKIDKQEEKIIFRFIYVRKEHYKKKSRKTCIDSCIIDDIILILRK